MTPEEHSIKECFEQINNILSNSKSVPENKIQAEVELIFEAAYKGVTEKNISRINLYSRPLLDICPGNIYKKALKFAYARAKGAPLPYILGEKAFYNHTYSVGPGVLIPRPETEILVSEAINQINNTHKSSDTINGIEIGLGSGIISIELLSVIKTLFMTSTETSTKALKFAEENINNILKNKNASRLKIIQTKEDEVFPDSFKPIRTDFLISNPPYLHESDFIEKEVLGFEPKTALFPKSNDPMYFYNAIATQAKNYLKNNAKIFLEIPHERSTTIQKLFYNNGWKTIQRIKDLNSLDRVLIIQ